MSGRLIMMAKILFFMLSGSPVVAAAAALELYERPL